MPLPPPVERHHRHTRSIEFRGFERADGLWDVEGHITDIKTYGFENQDRGWIEPFEPIHDMWIRLTVDLDFVVREVHCAIDAGPYTICLNIEGAFQKLVGLKVASGWYREVRARVGGVRGCTHVTEMMAPIATAVFQSLYPAIRDREQAKPAGERQRPLQIDGCHALAADGPIVKKRWPDFYEGD